MLKNYLTHHHSVINYLYKLLNAILTAILLLIITAIIYIVLLYLSKMLWGIYISTPMGKQFFFSSGETAQIIIDLLERDVVHFSVELTITAFIICLLISAIGQVFYVARFLYHSRGLFGKILFWGLPMTAVVAVYVQSIYEFDSWITAFAAAFVPTLSVFTGCFKFSNELLPEIGSMVQNTFPKLMEQAKKISEKINKS